MTIDEKYQKLSATYSEYLKEKQKACNEKYAEIERVGELRKSKSKFVGKLLKKKLYSIKPSNFHRKIRKLVKVRKGGVSTNNTVGNFDKFMYYIDMINAKRTPRYIVRKNPKYCEEILPVVVEEYYKLSLAVDEAKEGNKDMIKNEKKSYLTATQKEVSSKMATFYEQLEALAGTEADSIINGYRDKHQTSKAKPNAN